MVHLTLASGLTLYLIRHGETDWNAEGRLQGGQDILLNARGREQAGLAARKLAGEVAEPGKLAWLCSPMTRARDTMVLARAALGLEPKAFALDQRLSEITFGRWEGLTWQEVRAREPELARARETDKWGFVPPGGESYAMLMKRVMPVFGGLTQDTVVVSHGGVMRAALVGFGLLAPRQAESLDIWQGRIIVLRSGSFAWR